MGQIEVEIHATPMPRPEGVTPRASRVITSWEVQMLWSTDALGLSLSTQI